MIEDVNQTVTFPLSSGISSNFESFTGDEIENLK